MVVRSSLNKRRGGVVELDGTIQLKRRGPTSGRAWAATSALASIFAPRGRLIVSLFVVVSLLFGAVAATSTESTTSSAAPAPADVLVANETVAFDEVMNATALDVGEGLNVTSDDTDANAKLEEFRRKSEERWRTLGGGKPGDKHLRHELSRLGFDVGQEHRSNLRNVKVPLFVPQIGTKSKVKVPCRRKPDKALRSILGQAYNARYMAFVNPGVPQAREIFDDVPSIADAFVGDQPAADDPEALPFSVDSGYRQVLEGQVMIHHKNEEKGQPSNVHFARSRRELNDTVVPPDVSVPDDPVSVSDDFTNSTLAVDESRVDEVTVKPENGTKTPAELLLEKTKGKFKDVKRTKENNDLWTCKYELRWTDLGQDHYPRYLREAVCLRKKCWFGQFECRPKAFTVKVLKRWSDSCEISNEQYLSFVASKSSGSYDLSNDHLKHDHGDLAVDYVDPEVPPELQEKWVWEEIGVNFCCECANSHA